MRPVVGLGNRYFIWPSIWARWIRVTSVTKRAAPHERARMMTFAPYEESICAKKFSLESYSFEVINEVYL